MDVIKRRDVGIAGALVILAQAITSSESTRSINDELQELRKSILMAKIEREQYFVRKVELSSVVTKMDKVSDQITSLKDQISSIKHRVEESYTLEECDPLISELQCKEMVSRE